MKHSSINDDRLDWILTHCFDIRRLHLDCCNVTSRMVELLVGQIKKRTQRVIMSNLCRNNRPPKGGQTTSIFRSPASPLTSL